MRSSHKSKNWLKVLIALCLSLISQNNSAQISFNPNQNDILEVVYRSKINDITTDHQHNIWFATDRGMYKFNGYTVKHFSMAQGMSDSTIYFSVEDSMQRIWFGTSNGSFCYIKNDVVYNRNNDNLLANINYDKANTIFHISVLSKDRVYIYHQYENVIYSVRHDSTEIINLKDIIPKPYLMGVTLMLANDHFISVGQESYSVKKGNELFTKKIGNMISISDNYDPRIFFLTRNQIIQYNDDYTINLVQDINVNDVKYRRFENLKGQLFFNTNLGFFLNGKLYFKNTFVIRSIIDNNNNLWILYKNEEKNEIVKVDYDFFMSNLSLFENIEHLRIAKSQKNKYKIQDITIANKKFQFQKSGFKYFDEKNNTYSNNLTDNISSKNYDISIDNHTKSMIISTDEGIYEYSVDGQEFKKISDKILYKFSKYEENHLIGHNDSNIIRLNNKGNILESYNTSFRIKEAYFTSSYIVIVSHDNELYLLPLKQSEFGQIEYYGNFQYPYYDSLSYINNEFLIHYNGNKLKWNPNNTKPNAKIESLKSNKKISFWDYIKLSANDNTTINYNIQYFGNEHFIYEITIIDENKSIINHVLNPRATSLNINLPSGNYDIHIYAKHKNNKVLISQKSIKLSHPFYYQNYVIWTIRILVLVAISLVCFLIVKLIVKLVRKRKKKKKVFEELKSKELIKGVQNHMTLNFLNTVQFQILEGKNENANELILQFSNMVRSQLNHWDKGYWPLKEELAIIYNYINIQKVCYESLIEFNIYTHVKDNLLMEQIIIPQMILLNCIENSIKHSRLKYETPLSITVTITENKSAYTVLIEDNNKLVESRNRNSFGHIYIKERLAQFNANNKTKFSFEFSSLSHPNDKTYSQFVFQK